MIDFNDLLKRLPWFKKVCEYAETMPPNAPAPWEHEPIPGEIVIGAIPENLRNIIAADFILGKTMEEEAQKHDYEHATCSFTCPFIIEVLSQYNERLILDQLFKFILARSLVHIQEIPFRILSDWRMVTTSKTSTADPFEDFSEENIPPPSEEEKKYEGS